MAPYNMPPEPLLVPALSFHWPTVLPAFPGPLGDPGQQWHALINLQYGVGRFEVPYTAKLLRYLDQQPEIAITPDPLEAHSTFEDITLSLKAQGSVLLGIAPQDGIWSAGNGQLGLSIRAQGRNDDDKPFNVEVLNWQCDFDFKRVQITFDDHEVVPSSVEPLFGS